ncbi:hypothetical protein E2C01_008312 [Portunus trituberculatus]|uniref:Uncharacterized protein n=1 Tax=Portunus trituberculatus TaxID=210409 RepID=A0A5B7D1F8_PORTR|nr:hypothetical protein [Portunus trituberculatus]
MGNEIVDWWLHSDTCLAYDERLFIYGGETCLLDFVPKTLVLLPGLAAPSWGSVVVGVMSEGEVLRDSGISSDSPTVSSGDSLLLGTDSSECDSTCAVSIGDTVEDLVGDLGALLMGESLGDGDEEKVSDLEAVTSTSEGALLSSLTVSRRGEVVAGRGSVVESGSRSLSLSSSSSSHNSVDVLLPLSPSPSSSSGNKQNKNLICNMVQLKPNYSPISTATSNTPRGLEFSRSLTPDGRDARRSLLGVSFQCRVSIFFGPSEIGGHFRVW